MIQNNSEADKMLNDIRTFYIQSICENPIPDGLFPHLAFFEDVDMYDKPVYYRVYVLNVNQETKECWIKYENGSKDTIFLSALNIDWLKTIAERQKELNSINQENRKVKLKDLLQKSSVNLPPTGTYQEILSFFKDNYNCQEEQVRKILGNRTGDQILSIINLLDKIELGQIYTIPWDNKSFKALDYTLNGTKYTISEIDLAHHLMSPNDNYYNLECERMDNEIQYFVNDTFWGKSPFEQKMILITEVWNN